MRKQIRKISGLMTAAALAAFATASIARANDQVVATVPFPFIAGDARMPAGEYSVTVASEDMSVWSITSVDGKHHVLISTIAASPARTPTPPELVFDKFANEYFLAKVVVDGSDEREIPLKPAKMEHEIIKVALK